MLTKKQIEVGKRLQEKLKVLVNEPGFLEAIRNNIRKENEEAAVRVKAQIPTWEQMHRPFDI